MKSPLPMVFPREIRAWCDQFDNEVFIVFFLSMITIVTCDSCAKVIPKDCSCLKWTWLEHKSLGLVLGKPIIDTPNAI